MERKIRTEPRYLRQMAINNLVHGVLYAALAICGSVGSSRIYLLPNTFQFKSALVTMTTFFFIESPMLLVSFWYRLRRESSNYNVMILNLVRTMITVVRYCINVWLIFALFKINAMDLTEPFSFWTGAVMALFHVCELLFLISIFMTALLRPIVCCCI